MPQSIFPGPLSPIASLVRETKEGAHGVKQVRQFVSPELCLCVCRPCLDLCHPVWLSYWIPSTSACLLYLASFLSLHKGRSENRTCLNRIRAKMLQPGLIVGQSSTSSKSDVNYSHNSLIVAAINSRCSVCICSSGGMKPPEQVTQNHCLRLYQHLGLKMLFSKHPSSSGGLTQVHPALLLLSQLLISTCQRGANLNISIHFFS